MNPVTTDNRPTDPLDSRRAGGKTRSADTRALYLDAAEQVFAEKGYDGATIRAISKHANVQLGALHYYWGNKQTLFLEVIQRRFAPIVKARLQRLRLITDGPAEARRNILGILTAYYEPVIESAAEDTPGIIAKLVLRIQTDPAQEAQAALTQIAEEAALPFVTLLRSACDHLDEETFYWRLVSLFGAMMFVIGNRAHIARLVTRNSSAEDQMRLGAIQTLKTMSLMFAARDTP
jgi:AcrR family transcriptional regulator